MAKNDWKYGDAGTVSHATMRNEDLIPRFMDELIKLGHHSNGEAYRTMRSIAGRIKKAVNDWEKHGKYWQSEDASHDLEWLFDALNEHAKDYFFFGAHPGDGSDYGFWLSEDFEEEITGSGGIKVNDTSEVPDDFEGDVLHVNDHGNATLYACEKGGKLTEIWSVV